MQRRAVRFLAGLLTLLVGSAPLMVGAAHLRVHRHIEHAELQASGGHLDHGTGPVFETAAAAEHEHVVLVARAPQDRPLNSPDIAVVAPPVFALPSVVRRIPPADASMQWFLARQHGPPPPARAPPSA